MRLAIYARASTKDQSVNLQIDGLREYARHRQFEIMGEYLDEGISGARSSRPALDRLLTDARRGRLDAVAVWRLDRLARSVRHLVNLANDFEALGVDLIALDQGIDTRTSAGRFLFHTLAAVGELERDLIRERTRAGVAAARRRGKRLGRPRAYVKVARARALLIQGLTKSAVARELGVPRTTLVRHLTEKVLEAPRVTPRTLVNA